MSLKPCSFSEVAMNLSTLQMPKYSPALKSSLKNHAFDDSDIQKEAVVNNSDFLQIECGVYACRNTGVVSISATIDAKKSYFNLTRKCARSADELETLSSSAKKPNLRTKTKTSITPVG